METMRAEIAAQPPVEGAYSARRGDNCIAKFADGEWYAKIPTHADSFKKHFWVTFSLLKHHRASYQTCFRLQGGTGLSFKQIHLPTSA